ncbi:MAG: metal ABC transporter permease [Xanthobacteraceae bacterium]|nr:metal ABC transporter permease [Xanthobacteraceae bacterium]
MTDALAFLLIPFVVAVCLVGIHTYFGLQVLARRVIFVDLALAQVAALGATVGFMLGHPAQGLATYGYSLTFAITAAALLAGTRAWAGRVPQEALIGVVYVVAAAASILLVDRAPQGAEHLKQILTGNILTTGFDELAAIVPIYGAVGLLHWLFRSRLDGGGPFAWEFVFYATFGVVVTSSVAIAGVLLVFSFLIIPAAIGVIYAADPSRQLAIGWISGMLASAAGLGLSFAFDLPTGATMVCTFGAALAVAGLGAPLCGAGRAHALRRGIAVLRWSVFAILAASAVSFAAAPRADQPLVDAAEHLFPSLRNLYFSRSEQATFTDAGAYAERYRLAADALNEDERNSRSRGSLDDFGVARLSSFLKSYGEMRRGEEFVMGEVRARARERVRWLVGAGLLALALIAAPLPRARLWSRPKR